MHFGLGGLFFGARVGPNFVILGLMYGLFSKCPSILALSCSLSLWWVGLLGGGWWGGG